MNRPSGIRLIRALALREVREMFRSGRFLGLAVGVPMFLFFLFAYAMFPEIESISFVALDLSRSAESRDYIEALNQTGYFKLRGYAAGYDDLHRRMSQERLRAAVVIPEDFARDMAAGRQASVQALVDGTIPATATVVEGYLEGATGDYARRRLERHMLRLYGLRPRDVTPIAVESRVWFNENLKTTNFVVPGLLAVILMFYPVMLATLAVTREKETGSILNVYTSPVRGWHYFAGKLAPHALFSFGLYLLMFAGALWWFQVPFRGSFLLLSAATAMFIWITVGLGLIFSLLIRSQAAAVLAAAVLTIVPSFLFSGFFMPVALLPPETQSESRLFPVMYYMDIVRSIFLKGSGLGLLRHDFLFLVGYGMVVFGAAVALFRKRA